MFKNKYDKTALALYMNFFVHGIQAIILSQGIVYFSERWQATESEVFGVIAAVGIGKTVVMLFSGILSDKFGRKPMAIIGMIGYLVFFGGLLLCQNTTLAFILAIVAGGATSFLDGASYPALAEMYPQKASIAIIIMKGFIAVAAALLPLFISFLNINGFFFGWTLIIPFIIILVNFIFVMRGSFPDEAAKEEVAEQKAQELGRLIKQPHYFVEGTILIIFSFFCMSTFYLWQQTATKFAMDVVGMGEIAARGIMSVYSIGSLLSVVVTSIIMSKGIKDIAVVTYYTFISSITLLALFLMPTPSMMYIGTFIVGFFTAGGILQIGNSLLSQFFPERKGLNTSIYNVAFALASYVMPLVTKGLLQNNEFANILLLMVGLSAISFVTIFVLGFFYKKTFGKSVYKMK